MKALVSVQRETIWKKTTTSAPEITIAAQITNAELLKRRRPEKHKKTAASQQWPVQIILNKRTREKTPKAGLVFIWSCSLQGLLHDPCDARGGS